MESSERIIISTVSTVMFYSIIGVFILNIPNKKVFNVPKTIEIYVANIDKQMNQVEQEVSQEIPKDVKKTEKPSQKPNVKQNSLEKKQLPPVINNKEITNNIDATKDNTTLTKNIVHPSIKTSNEAYVPQKQHIESALAKYLTTVRQKIQEEIKYPITAKRIGLEGETIVRFSISLDGSVKDGLVEIIKSSGNNSFDKSAVSAVLDASLFDKPPVASMEIVIPVVFKLNNKG